MRLALLLGAVLVFSEVAFAEDWRARLTPITPGEFAPLRPLRATYKFGWAKVDAATATFDFAKKDNHLLQLTVDAHTEGFVRNLWRMDTQQTSLAEAATLRPVEMRQVEAYKKQTLTTTLNFGPEGVARLKVSEPADKNPPKTKRFKMPEVFDLHTALLFVRSQPLAVGDVVRMVVYPSTDPYLAEVEVLDREPLSLQQENRPALKLAVKLRRISKKLTLAPHKSFKRATAWLSDDADRLLLKIQADIFVGNVWAELESVSFREE